MVCATGHSDKMISKFFTWFLGLIGYDAGGDVTAVDIQRHDLMRGIPSTATVYGVERPRSDKWPEVRKAHLKEEPVCQWCGGSEKLQVHHIAPFHLHPELELDDINLITLCEEGPGRDCHLTHGHLGNFFDFNPAIRAQCEARKT